MSKNYSYLKEFIGHNDLKGNYFLSINEDEIKNAEKKLGQEFPDQLRQFYQEIGTGILSCGYKYPELYAESINNEILPPRIAVDYMQGIIEHPDDDSYYMSASTYEDLQPGDLPFFEIGDGSSFMVMKLYSDNPNAVYSDCGVKIEDSFERFIYRLYHESPAYYGDIIENHYAAKKK